MVQKLPAGHSEAEKFITELDQKTEAARIANDWDLVETIINIIINHYKGTKDKQNLEKYEKSITETFISKLNHYKNVGMSGLILQHEYTRTITRLDGKKEFSAIREKLLSELSKVQKVIPSEMKSSSEEFDLEPMIKSFKEKIQGHTFIQALIILGNYTYPNSKKELIKNSEELIKAYPVQHLFSRTQVDEKGKATYITKGKSNNEDYATMQALINLKFRFQIGGFFIKHANHILYENYVFDKSDLDLILSNNPFIPDTRFYQFRDGIWNGLNGKWPEAIYMLVPLLENSLREMMAKSGYEAIVMDENCVQREKLMNELIYEKEFSDLFGEDEAFQLQALLCHKAGLNIRNNLAHGLLSDGAAYSDYSAYIWAKVIHLTISVMRTYYLTLEHE